MNDRDYAVLVGISTYPLLGPNGSPANLVAPVEDAKLIEKWLLDPEGGDLPSKNIKTIFTPPSLVDDDPTPTAGEVTRAANWLAGLARKQKADSGSQQFGRRLYLYMAGHGFAPKDREAAVFTAPANADIPEHVWATDMFDWLARAGFFEEVVLWVDSCATQQSTPPTPFPRGLASTDPANRLIGLASDFSKEATERPIAAHDDQVHGVFTWTLYRGLYDARDAAGVITGMSLQRYVEDNMKSLLSQEDIDSDLYSTKPIFFPSAKQMVFGKAIPMIQLPAVVNRDVVLKFPNAAVGRTARIWSSRKAQPDIIRIDTSEVTVSIPSGFYVVEVPDVRLRHGFEVTETQEPTETISETGPPVTPAVAGAQFVLSVGLGEVAAETIVDDANGECARGQNYLSVRLPFGVYRVRARIGDAESRRIILLDASNSNIGLQPPPIRAAVPLQGTDLIHEYHEVLAEDLRNRASDSSPGTGAQIFLMDRVWNPSREQPGSASPERVVELIDANGVSLFDLWGQGQLTGQQDHEDAAASALLDVNPGAYILRETLPDGRQFEQSLLVPDGRDVMYPGGPTEWLLEVYIIRSPADNKLRPLAGRRVSLLLNRRGEWRNLEQDRLIETASLALAAGLRAASDEVLGLLAEKFNNPIAGIMGGQLLLQSADEDTNLSLLNTVVRNLRSLLGTSHPDVEALSLACPDESLRSQGPIAEPPMFAASWNLLLEASVDGNSLVPTRLWNQVSARYDVNPHLAWWGDRASRNAYRQQLRSLVNVVQPQRPSSDLQIGGAVTPRRVEDERARAGSDPRAIVRLRDLERLRISIEREADESLPEEARTFARNERAILERLLHNQSEESRREAQRAFDERQSLSLSRQREMQDSVDFARSYQHQDQPGQPRIRSTPRRRQPGKKLTEYSRQALIPPAALEDILNDV